MQSMPHSTGAFCISTAEEKGESLFPQLTNNFLLFIQQHQQLKDMKNHLEGAVEQHEKEIQHHEEAIRRHREALEKHKKGINKLAEADSSDDDDDKK